MKAIASADRVFLDTNVLVYAYDAEARAKQARARNLIIDHLGGRTLAVSIQVLLEFYWTVTRKPEVPIAHPVAAGFVEQFRVAHVVTPTPHMVSAGLQRCADGQLSVWEALILEAAESCGARVLYTEDKHLLAADANVDVVNPFAGLAGGAGKG